MKLASIILVSVLLSTTVYSQTPAWTDPLDFAVALPSYTLVIDRAGNVFLSGDNQTRKYDGDGNEVWRSPYGIFAMQLTSGGGVIVEDSSQSTLRRLSSNGDLLWTLHTGSPAWYIDHSDNIVVNTTDGKIRKYSSDAIFQWDYTLPHGNDYLIGVQFDASNNVYVLFVFDYSITVLKLTGQGALQWKKSWKTGSPAPARESMFDFQNAVTDRAGNLFISGFNTLSSRDYIQTGLIYALTPSGKLHTLRVKGSGYVKVNGHKEAENLIGHLQVSSTGIVYAHGTIDHRRTTRQGTTVGKIDHFVMRVSLDQAQAWKQIIPDLEDINYWTDYPLIDWVGTVYHARRLAGSWDVVAIDSTGELKGSVAVPTFAASGFDPAGNLFCFSTAPRVLNKYPPLPVTPVAHNSAVQVEMNVARFRLENNYPNPFNPTTTIEFALPVPAIVTLKVYNMLGQEVATLLNHESMDDGEQDVEFSATGGSASGGDASTLPSGVYFYRLVAQGIADEETGTPGNKFVSVKKMVLIK